MLKQTLTAAGLVFLLTFLSLFTAEAQAAEPAFNLIKEVETDLIRANELLNEIEQAKLTEGGASGFVVSVTEIRNKITLAQEFLDRAITFFEAGDYEPALIQAKLAESNSELAIYYLGALLNRPSPFNIRSLFLQGDLLDLLNLRSAFNINELAVRLGNLLAILNSRNQDQDGEGETAAIQPPTAEALLSQCLEENKTRCQDNLNSCLAAKKAPASTCTLDFASRQARCDDLFARAASRITTCEVERNTCLQNTRGQNAVSCTNRFNTCAVRAERLAERDNRLATSCQERVDRGVARCEEKYLADRAQFEQSTFECFDANSLCVTQAEAACRQ